MVPADLHGCQLGDYLERRFPRSDRTELRRLILDGKVRCNGMPSGVQRRLREGDVVTVQEPPRARKVDAPEMPELTVLFESASVLVVQKPAGLPTVPDRHGKVASVHALLPGLRPDGDLRIVHRLDRDTSGCLVLAKGLEPARHMDRLLQEHLVQKQYLALVEGVMVQDQGAIELPLGPDPSRPGKVLSAPRLRRGFRAAHTDFEVVERFAAHTLLRLQPRTGRGHQLRVHLAASGHPIVADADYGGVPLLLSGLKRRYKQRPGIVEAPLLQRMFLHAAAITFADLDGATVAVQAPLPADLQNVLTKLARLGRKRR